MIVEDHTEDSKKIRKLYNDVLDLVVNGEYTYSMACSILIALTVQLAITGGFQDKLDKMFELSKTITKEEKE